MHRILILTLLSFLLLSFGEKVSAYSYAEAVDPMATIFKSAVVAAREGNWADVSILAEKGIALQKNHTFPADHLTSRMEKSISGKDVSMTAEHFAHLVYLSIREKLHQNKKEKFRDFKSSKARLQLAYKSYLDVLDGNIRQQDAPRSSSILKQFNNALDSLGNPGLFGIGKKAPAPAKYDQALNTIEKLITKSFPGFSR